MSPPRLWRRPQSGDPTDPKIGDQRITSVVLIDKHKNEVGTGTGICTLVSLPAPGEDGLVQCFITVSLAKKGHFGIFGGTDDFRIARGEVTLVVISEKLQDATFDIEIDSEQRHGKFAE